MVPEFLEMPLVDVFQDDAVNIVLEVRHLIQAIREDLGQFVPGVRIEEGDDFEVGEEEEVPPLLVPDHLQHLLVIQRMLLQAVPFDLYSIAGVDPLHVLLVLLPEGQRDLHQSELVHVLVVEYRDRLLSQVWVFDEESLDEVLETLAQAVAVGGDVLDLLQEGVGLGLVGLRVVAEGQRQVDQVVEDGPDGPDIHGVRIGGLQEDLRCHVPKGAHSPSPDWVLFLLVHDRYPEISQLHLEELIDKDILGFDTAYGVSYSRCSTPTL